MRLPLLPRQSTRAFVREARRTPGYSLFDWLHGYVYGRWTYLYIGIGTGEHPLAKLARPAVGWVDALIRSKASESARENTGADTSVEFADTYHGKVMTLEGATQLVRVGRDVDLGDLEQIIPYALARDIVLQHPDHIIALQCPCRVSRPNPCQPLDVCLIVGEPFASFTAEHHPQRTRWITQDEAERILTEEHERGHVHHAFFKDAMLGRFYAICNCCECCCGAMQAHFQRRANAGVLRLRQRERRGLVHWMWGMRRGMPVWRAGPVRRTLAGRLGRVHGLWRMRRQVQPERPDAHSG